MILRQMALTVIQSSVDSTGQWGFITFELQEIIEGIAEHTFNSGQSHLSMESPFPSIRETRHDVL